MGAKDQGADETKNRWLTIPRTLCFVINGDDILLMKRATTRRVFPNRYNGVGGHIEHHEDPMTGAIREIREETGLEVKSVKLCGIHNIDAGQDTGIMMFVFTAESENRDILEPNHEEGTLHWVPKKSAIGLDLVEDLPLILPRILSMKPEHPPYFAHVSYNANDQIQIHFTE